MNPAGNHFLSRAAFARDQDRRISHSNTLHQRVDSAHENMIANKINGMWRLS
jgi:hypothetical protein